MVDYTDQIVHLIDIFVIPVPRGFFSNLSIRWPNLLHLFICLQVIFVIYMVLVTLLLVNMLIAMMGNTYQVVSETEKEWLRQVRESRTYIASVTTGVKIGEDGRWCHNK